MPGPNYRDVVMRANITIRTIVCLHGTTGSTGEVQVALDPYQTCPAPAGPTQPSLEGSKEKRKQRKQEAAAWTTMQVSQLTETKRMRFHQHPTWHFSQQDRLGSIGWLMKRHLLALLSPT